MVKSDYASKDKLDPIETGDTIANWIVCLVVLFGCHYLIFWLAGGQ